MVAINDDFSTVINTKLLSVCLVGLPVWANKTNSAADVLHLA